MAPKDIIFKLSSEQLDFIETMAKEIYQCPRRNQNRDYRRVYNSTKAGVILEFALERQGAIKNPKQFDHTDRDSYAWDVMWNGKRTEVKRKQFLRNNSSKYYTWNNSKHVDTFLKNAGYVQQLIVGDYEEIDGVNDTYNVKWMLATQVGKDFKKFIKKSMYNEGQMYYNHKYDKNCTYLL